jgi:broad specificity phosphatase PhoE
VSPFTRTLETAAPIADALDLPLRIDEGICEWLCGDWFGGKPFYWPSLEEAKAAFPRIDMAYTSTHKPLHPETREQVGARCAISGRALIAKHLAAVGADKEVSGEDDVIVLVAHGKIVEDITRGLDGGDVLPWVTFCSATHVLQGPSTVHGEFMFRRTEVVCDVSFIPAEIRPAATRSYA